MFRRLPPVRSPLPWTAIVSGVRAVLRERGDYDTLTERVRQLLLELMGSRDLLFTDSGTSALALAISATASASAGPVAIPAYACFDIATAVDTAGGDFVAYDIDRTTLMPSMSSLRCALELGADRVVIVHPYGIPVDMDATLSLLAEFGATCIEDAAQGAGALWKGRRLGTNASLGVLSFGRGKGMTGGSGGALIANDETGMKVIERLGALALPLTSPKAIELVKVVAQYVLARPALYALPASLPFLRLGDTPYHTPHVPRGISPMALGFIEQTISLVDREAQVRRLNADSIIKALKGSSLTLANANPAALPGYLRLPLLPTLRNTELARSVEARALGIMSGYPSALIDLAGFGARAIRMDGEVYQGARYLAAHLITAPVHGGITGSDLACLVQWCETLM